MPHYFATLSVFVSCCTFATLAEDVTVYNLPALHTLGDAGHMHGRLAADRIRDFFVTREIKALLSFARSAKGLPILKSLRAEATLKAPWLAEELAGIAEGAGVALADIWAVNLISELEYAGKTGKDHCSDVLARELPSGEVWHGHNEDWSLEFRPLMYFVIYNSWPTAEFRPVGGLVYPGQAPGFAVVFTPTVWSTSNSLFPVGLNQSGLCIVAAARIALQAQEAQSVAHSYARAGQAYGMNTQIVAQAPGWAYAADVEVAGAAGQSYIDSMGDNMTHFNGYKYLDVSHKVSESSRQRQATADRHLAPRSSEDVLEILGDTSNKQLPIYRENNTMFTVLFNSKSGSFHVWHGRNPNLNEPDWESSLRDVFNASTSEFVSHIDHGRVATVFL